LSAIGPILHSAVAWILLVVAAQRLGELVLASANTRRLLAEGAREVGRAHYPLIIALHASWLVAIALTTPLDARPNWLLLGVFVVLQGLRVWVVATLGRYWTTRVITLDGAPLVRSGLFRVVRHPNYLVVIAEIAVLPLVFNDWPVAIIWSLANAVLLTHRMRVESRALATRAALGA
jgi:methyltransferase